MAWSWKTSLLLVPGLAVVLGLGIAILNALPFAGLGWRTLDMLLDPVRRLTNSTSYSSAAVPGPKTYVLSEDPVVVYIRDFLTKDEAAQLVRMA
jgi:hypothetical protein